MREAHIVALSGGKDSTAMALRLKEIEPQDYEYVCTPTGDELPEMFAHWKKLGEILGKPIKPIMAHTGLNGLIEEQRAIPNNRMRFCTRILKIEPYRRYLAKLCETHDRVVSYVGLRADEEGRAGGAYSDIDGVEMRFPMREWEWGLADVWQYLALHKVSIPERTDCARCYHQRLIEWWRLWNYQPEIYSDAEQQEIRHGYTFRSKHRDTWPAALSDLRAEFEKGRIPKTRKDNRRLDLMSAGGCRVCSL